MYTNGYTNINSIDYNLIDLKGHNFQLLIHQSLIETYGMEEYRRHKNSIEMHCTESIHDRDLNIDLISAIFVLKEILCENSTDSIFNYNMGLHERNIFHLTPQEQYVKRQLQHIESLDIKLYICMELIKERFRQIKMIITNNGLIPAQIQILKNENTYPIFIVVKEKNGEETLY